MYRLSIMESYEKVMKESVNGKIYCHCVYQWKDKLKALGFKWDGSTKLWWIPKDKLTREIYDNTCTVRYSNKTSIGRLDYYYVHYIGGADAVALAKNTVAMEQPEAPKKKINNKEFLF